MLPSIEDKLQVNRSFKRLITSAMCSVIKSIMDELTITRSVANEGERKALEWCRGKMITGSIYDHSKQDLQANLIYVAGILAMFDDSQQDDIEHTVGDDEQGNLIINWDVSKPILVARIENTKYIYALAGATKEDFEKTSFNEATGQWEEPAI